MWVMGQPVTGNGTNQYIVYEFLLAFHNNFGPISYHFRGKASYWCKIAIFFHTPLAFDAPVTGWVPYRNMAIRFGIGKLKCCGYPR